ncbi:MAG: NADH-quinone oxidoreductase subunit NuoK [Clostridiales bacterium]
MMADIGLLDYLLLAAGLFAIGLYGALVKKHAIAVLLSIELMLNAVNINFLAFSKYLGDKLFFGEIFAIFVIVIAAAEVAVGLAICIALYRSRDSLDLEKFNILSK